MKIVFALILASLLLAAAALLPVRHKPEALLYASPHFGYRFMYPPDFALDDSVPELVFLHRPNAWLKVNAGCYASGTEGLGREVSEKEGRLVEEFYDDRGRLFMKRLRMRSQPCLSLEMGAGDASGWRQLESIALSFRLTR